MTQHSAVKRRVKDETKKVNAEYSEENRYVYYFHCFTLSKYYYNKFLPTMLVSYNTVLEIICTARPNGTVTLRDVTASPVHYLFNPKSKIRLIYSTADATGICLTSK